MGWKIVWLEIASDDLKGIVEHVAQDDPEAAEREGLRIIRKVESLQNLPDRGARVPERDEPFLHQVLHGSYRIIYKIRESRGAVEIWRIWHTSRESLDLAPLD